MPEGKSLIFFRKTEYPSRRNEFLFTADFAMFLGAIKEILVSSLIFFIYLRLKLSELTERPSLNIFLTSLVLALFFLGNMFEKLNCGESFSAFVQSSFQNKPASFGSGSN